MENTLLILLVILFSGLLVPELFKKFRIPFVTTLILLGGVLGPHGFGYVQSNEIIEFFGFLGFTFLMLLAGLEAKPSDLKDSKKQIAFMAIVNAIIPSLVGIALMRWLGYSWEVSFLIALIFISSSVAIVIPSIKSTRVRTKFKNIMISSVVAQDAISLVLIAIFFQGLAPIVNMSLPVYIVSLALAFTALKFLLPKLSDLFLKKRFLFSSDEHEDRLRFVVVVLIGVLAIFSLLGIHPILAAFLVGVLLAQDITSEHIDAKLHTLGYGIFVPVFFFIIGMEMDWSVFTKFDPTDVVLIALPLGLIVSKIFSGYISARLSKMSNRESMVFGIVSTSQLTTTLAASYAAFEMGLLTSELLTAILILSIVTTIFAPLFLRFLFVKKT